MAKNRFTDAEKWKDEWFSNLSNDNKIVWLYLLDDCDHAGIWKKNLKLLNFNCNTNLTENELYGLFNDRVIKLSEEKWFIKKFCEFQYGKDFLNKKSKPIQSALNILIKEGLLEVDSKGNHTLSIPYTNSMNTLNIEYSKSYDTPKDKEQEQEQVQDKIQEQVKEQYKDKVEYRKKDLDRLDKDEKEAIFDSFFNEVII